MATAGPAQNQTVEEILASIRKAISGDGTNRGDGGLGADPEVPTVRRLFPADDSPAASSGAGSADDGGEAQQVIDMAIERALDGVRAELGNEADEEETTAPAPASAAVGGSSPGTGRPAGGAARVERPQRSLLSSQAGAAVSASFDDLAKSMLSNTHRLEVLVESLLRPMLRSWLDDNLPLLVERLVREEIERVSRGRR